MEILKESKKSHFDGPVKFKCDKCGCVFKANDVEYMYLSPSRAYRGGHWINVISDAPTDRILTECPSCSHKLEKSYKSSKSEYMREVNYVRVIIILDIVVLISLLSIIVMFGPVEIAPGQLPIVATFTVSSLLSIIARIIKLIDDHI